MALNWRRLIGLEGIPTHPDTTGLGSDFPGSGGDRERGKFRESAYPRLTTVAISNDDGSDVFGGSSGIGGDSSATLGNVVLCLNDLITEIRLLRHALILTGIAADIEEPMD